MSIIKYQGKNTTISVELKDDVDTSIWAEIFKCREYRAAESAIISARHPIVDAGAHIGLFTLYAHDLNRTVPIYSLEPEAKNFARLKENIKQNHLKDVFALPMAVAAASGKRDLLLSKDSHNHRLLLVGQNFKAAVAVEAVSLADFFKKYALK